MSVELGQRVRRGEALIEIESEAGAYTIASPGDGVVVALSGDVGAPVSRRARVAEVADVAEVRVVADVPEPTVAGVAPGTAVQIEIPDGVIDATIDFVSAIADPARRTVAIGARVANAAGKLRPNADARLRWFVNDPTQLVIPSSAVVDDGVTSYVYVQRGTEVVKTPVRLGWAFGHMIASGGALHAGDAVVTMGASEAEREGEP